ncbi:transient receptor potential cation channel subfamily M member 2-like [Paramacrobiotus metropolitanus]|uniref:transient receptor potential cation channel subfamily M member 2-like n=1 Tax=Paramacrobiotus metropolitanus TaxID=2943436 RepID=UPI00244629AA|nr:transient receptor potential cation channel subfamily M member 2-like [Paramacrobiotus metropolitanus]
MDSARHGWVDFGKPVTDAGNVEKVQTSKKARDMETRGPRGKGDDVPVLSMKKQFILIEHEHDVPGLAKEAVLRWFPRVPHAILSLVSGVDSFHSWKRDDFRSALQSGIAKLISTMELLLVDDGLNYGLTRLIASAVSADETFNSYAAANVMQQPRKPPAYYLGIAPVEKVADTVREQLEHLQRNTENEVDATPQKTGKPNDKFNLNRFHSHFVFVHKPYAHTGFLRVDLEKQLQNELGMRGGMADSPIDAVDEVSSAFIPHIVIFFQGEVDEIDRIRAYVRLRTPIIMLSGCGGMADIVAFAYKNASEPDEQRLLSLVGNNLVRVFPEAFKENKEFQMDCAQKILEMVRGPDGNGENHLMFIQDCSRLDSFDKLDTPFVQAAIMSSSEQNANADQLIRNMKLCMACNKPDIAQRFLVSMPPWATIQPKPPYTGFLTALILPGREIFIDMFMQQKFPVRYFTSHVDMLLCYRKAVGKEYFIANVWDDILGHNQQDPIREDFVLLELNWLIENLTGVKDFFNWYELSRVALLPTDDDPYAAMHDEKALQALVVYACLLNRPKLVKTLLKYSMDPVPLTVFVEAISRGLYRNVNNFDQRVMLKRQADEYGNIATDIMDMGIRDSPERAKVFFQRTLPDFNGKTTLEMAFDARNKKFISHNLVQDWLDQFAHGFVRVKGRWHDLKMILSAYLIFPMYIWLGFPRISFADKDKKVATQQGAAAVEYEPATPEAAASILARLQRGEKKSTDHAKYKEIYPPIHKMIYAVWNSPVVKFWTWFLTYLCFLVLLGTDMMLPACMYLGVDIAVFVCTALIWLELLTRTLNDVLWKRRVNLYMRAVDLIFQTVFNILFFLYRIAPYRWDHPFAGRVILAFGVMYYFYSIWNTFYGYDQELGPLVRIVHIMFKNDLPKWAIMLLPFFVATAVVWQAVITPDYPFTGDDWRKAFFRGLFTLFAGFQNELEYAIPACHPGKVINYNNFTQPASAYPQDRCWLGDYNDHTCATVTFWAYVFVIHYYVLLKLGMMIILTVFYIFRSTSEMPKANLVWRFYRFDTILDYYWRSSLPFPFNILGNLYISLLYFLTKAEDRNKVSDMEMSATQTDTFIYWKSKAGEYFAQKDKEEQSKALPAKQAQMIGAIKHQVTGIIQRFSEMDRKLHDVGETARDGKLRMHTANVLRQGGTIDLPQLLNPKPHFHCRETPYHGTLVRRTPVADNKVFWTTPFDAYRPDAYSKPINEFTSEEREFVDPEQDFVGRSSSPKRREWNGIEYHDDNVIYRKSWIVDEDGREQLYRLDDHSLPTNPQGRTGLRGRGSLCRFGPNHKIILAVTSNTQGKLRFILQSSANGSFTFPMIPLCHYDSEYSVIAVLFEAILTDGEGSEESDFDPAACRSLTSFLQAAPQMVQKQLQKNPDYNEGLPRINTEELYRGYQDMPLNTDNAWTELLIVHIDIPYVPLNKNSMYQWKASSTADLMLPDLETAIMKRVSSLFQ